MSTETTFASLGLPEPILAALTAEGYTTPTPIQAQSIPHLLENRDLLGLAETGTGKTAAFSLPILTKLSTTPRLTIPKAIRALILAPTRELAIQIHQSLETYGKDLGLSYACIFGGVGISPQIRRLQTGVDILVATPGRLIDLAGSRSVRFDHVQHFVLDEADRMLDMGFIRDVRRIVKALPKVRQSLLFSATMPSDIAELAAEMLHNPVRVEVARAGTTVDRITQRVHFVEGPKKRAALVALLKNPELARVIAFTRTKRGADRVARGLQAANIEAYAIHGNKSQSARQNALESFRTGNARVLVATDIAARGIDIDAITHVINYEIPNIPETYVHRIGRTARAGATGAAISLCASDERAYLRDIERLTGVKVPDGGAIDGIGEIDASLPPVRNNADDEESSGHFERSKGKVAGRRFVPRTLERDTWHEGRDLRAEAEERNAPAEDARSERPQRGDRPSRGEGAHRAPRRDGDRPYRARPDGDRGPRREGDNASRGDRPWQNRDRGEGGDRPHRARPDGDRAPRREGDNASRGDRPWQNRDRSEGGDRPHRARPEGDRGPRSDRPWQNRDRSEGGDRPHRARPEGDRGPRGDRPWQNRDRSEGGGDRPRHARPGGDGFKRREGGSDRPWQKRDRSEGGDRPHRGRPDGDRAPRRDSDNAPRGDRPWQNRDRNADRGGENRGRDGERPHHARGDGDRPRRPRPEGGQRPFNREGRPEEGRSEQRRDGRPPHRGGDRPRRFEDRGSHGEGRRHREGGHHGGPRRPMSGDRRPSDRPSGPPRDQKPSGENNA